MEGARNFVAFSLLLLGLVRHCGANDDLQLISPSNYLNCNDTVHSCNADTCNMNGNFSLMNNYRNLRACDCHPDCYTYGTCCANNEAVCSSVGPNKGKRAAANIVTCELTLSPYRESSKFTFMVTRCLRPLLDNVTLRDVELCENMTESVDQWVPVYKEPLLYRNMHCLRCNGHSLSEADEVVGTDFRCDEGYLKGEENFTVSFESLTFYQLNDLILSGKCRLLYRSSFPNLYCYENYVDTCDYSLRSSMPNFDLLEKICREYAFYMTIYNDNKWLYFKNIHCAECNGFHGESSQCISNADIPPEFKPGNIQKRPLIHTLSILIDFSGGVSKKLAALRACRKPSSSGLVNIATNRCALKVCPTSFILFNASHCISNESATFGDLLLNDASSLERTMKITVCYASETHESNIVAEMMKLMRHNSVQNTVISYSVIYHLNNQSCLEAVVHSTNIMEDLFRFSVPTYFLRDLNNNLGISSLSFSIPDQASIEGDKQLYEQVRPQLLNDNPSYSPRDEGIRYKHSNSYVFVPEFDVFLRPLQLFYEIDTKRESNGSWTSSLTGFVNIKRHFNCSQENFCILAQKVRVPVDAGLSIQGVLTAVGTYFSIGTLMVSIVIRWVFLPKNFRYLIQDFIQLTLFAAHVLYVISSSTSYSNTACIGLAATQHYCWLASFAFMNILGKMLFTAFRLLIPQGGFGIRKKILFLAYGWGFPALFVAGCLVVHFYVHPVYAFKDICWIANQQDLGYAFGLPVGLMLFINIVFFTLTSVALRSSMEDAAIASNAYSTKFKLELQFRLFFISGGTWVLGFLSNIPRMQFLAYPFVLLVSLNGFFVASNFTINAQTREIVKVKLSSLFTTSSR